MTYSSGAAAAGAAAAARARALNASGAIVKVTPENFLNVLQRQQEPLVICATGGFFGNIYEYLSSYKGLIFFTESEQPLDLPEGSEEIWAESIWVP
ncbi:MAG: hypothetical protein KME42_06385 [Tildeniella nuda ZEHNDER 1965/U140]|jgi:hypothetical protein|nr:hypothetical protein [Tildeniella nuda ZEHNDER 1965/U140]